MRDLYEFIFLAFCTEEQRLSDALIQAENSMRKYDFEPTLLLTYLKRRIEYRYFKDFMTKFLKSIKYYDNLK